MCALRATLLLDTARSLTPKGEPSPFDVDRTLVFFASDQTIEVLVQSGMWHPGFLFGQVVAPPGFRPVSGASLRLHDGSAETITNENGQFVLPLASPRAEVHVVIRTPAGEVSFLVPCRDPVTLP